MKNQKKPERTMIKVNGYEISEREFDMACAERKYMYRKDILEKEEMEDIVTVLTDASLMLEVAEKEKVAVDDAETDATIAKMKSNFKSEEDFVAAVNKMGDTMDMVRKRIEKNLRLRNFVNQKFFADTKVTDEDAKKYYDTYPERFKKGEEVRASHILFNPEEKETALTVHEMLLDGGDFAALAKEHSQCPSGRDGGDLGFFDKGKMVPEFEAAAFETEKGEISDLVETQFGYHIIKVTDKKTGGVFELDEIIDQLKQSMASSIVNHKIRNYTQELRKNADIVIDKEKLSAKISAK
jgi:peptidyl-prolyl cis-trans isomerase C